MRIFGCWLQPHLNSALKMKMKKILTISSIIFGGFLFAQNANLKQNFSTSELVKLQNSFPEKSPEELRKIEKKFYLVKVVFSARGCL